MIDYPYATTRIENLYDSDGWQHIPVLVLELDRLITTQPDVSIKRVTAPDEDFDDEPLHVVDFRGAYFIHNGHHRYVRAVLRGDKTIATRVVFVP